MKIAQNRKNIKKTTVFFNGNWRLENWTDKKITAYLARKCGINIFFLLIIVEAAFHKQSLPANKKKRKKHGGRKSGKMFASTVQFLSLLSESIFL